MRNILLLTVLGMAAAGNSPLYMIDYDCFDSSTPNVAVSNLTSSAIGTYNYGTTVQIKKENYCYH